MRVIEEHPFDLPYVRVCQPPIVPVHPSQVDDGIAGDAACQIDVGIEVTARERLWRLEDRLPAMQAGIARSGDRSPSAVAAVHKDDMIEPVDRFKAEDQRR